MDDEITKRLIKISIESPAIDKVWIDRILKRLNMLFPGSREAKDKMNDGGNKNGDRGQQPCQQSQKRR